MALYLKEVALLETTTNTLLKLTNVMEGIEGSAVFGYQTENVNIQTGANRTEQVVTRHTFDIRIKDDADPTTQATLTAWANNPELRFKASGYSGDTFFLWDEPVPIVFSRAYDLIGARHLVMTLDAVPGYNGATGSKKLPVYAGQNIMMLFNQFLGSSELFSGWSGSFGGSTPTFSNGFVNFSLVAGSSTIVSANYFFPFEDVLLTGRIRSGGGGGSVAAGTKITISFMNSSQVEISETTGGTLGLPATTYFDSGLTPTGTYYIRLKLFYASGSSGGGTITLPALRLGAGESAFAN